jgi:hypothetical protein
MLEFNYYKPKADVTDDIFDRICSGLDESEFAKPRIVTYYWEN